MVGSPRLEAKQNKGKCEESNHGQILETNPFILSYSRKRVSRNFFVSDFLLDSYPRFRGDKLSPAEAGAGMTRKR